MTIRVLFFASLAQRVGAGELSLELPESATAGDALERLAGRFDGLSAMRDTLTIAVNLAYVKADHRLADGDELALIPPVSGG